MQSLFTETSQKYTVHLLVTGTYGTCSFHLLFALCNYCSARARELIIGLFHYYFYSVAQARRQGGGKSNPIPFNAANRLTTSIQSPCVAITARVGALSVSLSGPAFGWS